MLIALPGSACRIPVALWSYAKNRMSKQQPQDVAQNVDSSPSMQTTPNEESLQLLFALDNVPNTPQAPAAAAPQTTIEPPVSSSVRRGSRSRASQASSKRSSLSSISSTLSTLLSPTVEAEASLPMSVFGPQGQEPQQIQSVQGEIDSTSSDATLSRTETQLHRRVRTILKPHVARACLNCKRAHLACDVARPCRRCVSLGKSGSCSDVDQKKRGRPRLNQKTTLGQTTPSSLSDADYDMTSAFVPSSQTFWAQSGQLSIRQPSHIQSLSSLPGVSTASPEILRMLPHAPYSPSLSPSFVGSPTDSPSMQPIRSSFEIATMSDRTTQRRVSIFDIPPNPMSKPLAPVLTLDHDGIITWAAPVVMFLLMLEPHQAVGQLLQSMMVESDQLSFSNLFQTALANPGVAQSTLLRFRDLVNTSSQRARLFNVQLFAEDILSGDNDPRGSQQLNPTLRIISCSLVSLEPTPTINRTRTTESTQQLSIISDPTTLLPFSPSSEPRSTNTQITIPSLLQDTSARESKSSLPSLSSSPLISSTRYSLANILAPPTSSTLSRMASTSTSTPSLSSTLPLPLLSETKPFVYDSDSSSSNAED